MKRDLLRRAPIAGCDELLDALTAQQHLAPHEPLAAALARTGDALGVCPGAVHQAVAWLGADPQTSLGRLRRTELMQLARSIHRFWSQAATAAAASAPALPSDRPS